MEFAFFESNCQQSPSLVHFFECSCFAERMRDGRAEAGASWTAGMQHPRRPATRTMANIAPHWSRFLQTADLRACVSQPAITKHVRERTGQIVKGQPGAESTAQCTAEKMYQRFSARPAPSAPYQDSLLSEVLRVCRGEQGR